MHSHNTAHVKLSTQFSRKKPKAMEYYSAEVFATQHLQYWSSHLLNWSEIFKISFRRYCIIFVLSLCNGSSAVSDEGKWNYKAVSRDRTSSKHPRNWDVSSISFPVPPFLEQISGKLIRFFCFHLFFAKVPIYETTIGGLVLMRSCLSTLSTAL